MKVDKRFSDNRKYTHTRLYFFDERETLGENLFNRRHRPHREYRKLLPEVFERAGLPANTKAKWSQYAGCSMCPCSPGFILDVPHFEIFVTLNNDDNIPLNTLEREVNDANHD